MNNLGTPTRPEVKVIEIWDNEQGWKQYCDNCGTKPEKKLTQEDMPTTCNNCGSHLTEIERI